MSPTDGHLHRASRASMRGGRHVERRPARHAAVDRRMKAWPRHTRLTLADTPDLYMREEMN